MAKAQLVITAVVLEGRSKTAVARDYELSRQWVHQLVARYQAHREMPTSFAAARSDVGSAWRRSITVMHIVCEQHYRFAAHCGAGRRQG